MTKYILSIDQGTTSSRAMILDQHGTPIAQAQQEFKQYYPQSGWVEHDPKEIWLTTKQCCIDAIKAAKLQPSNICAIGITNQRETTIIWDKKTGEAIHPAIVWQDRRTAELCKQLKTEPMAKQIQQKTGLLLDPYFSATKIAWILENVPNARKKAESGDLLFGTVDTYLLWMLTGKKSHKTDITNACRTLLFNIKDECWDDDLLKFFAIPKVLLPQVCDNCADFGVTEPSILGKAIPITAMIGDQQSALVGQACFQPGMMKSTYGTGCFIIVNTGPQIIHSKNNLLSTIAYRIDGKVTYAAEGSIFNAGTTIKWLRDNLHLIKNTNEVEALAASVSNMQGVYFVPAFTGLGAPYWDPDARGAILGLTRDTGIAEIVRASLEAVCYRSRDLIEAMKQDGLTKISTIRVDGGMANNNWMLSFLADITNHTVERPQHTETTAIGAGYLAALGAGIITSIDEIESDWKQESRYQPNISTTVREASYASWKRAVARVQNYTQPD